MNRKSILGQALILAGVMAISGNVSAASVSFSDSSTLTPTNWTDTLSFSKFNPALGTLNSVTFKLTGNVSGSAGYESQDTSPTIVSLDLAALLTLMRPDTSTLVTSLPVANVIDNATAWDGTNDNAGTSGSTFSTLSASVTETASSSSAGDLALFTGPGIINLDVFAKGTSSGNGGGNLTTQFVTNAAADVTVTYNYTSPVPVPAAVWLFGSGLLGLVGVARHKKS